MVVLGKMVIKGLAVYGCIEEDGPERISCIWLYWGRWLLNDYLCMIVLGKMVIKRLAVYGCIGEEGPERISYVWLYWGRWFLKD